MSGIEVFGITIGVVSFVSYFPVVLVNSYRSLKKEYGSGLRLLLLLFIFPDARETIQRIQRRILCSRGEEAMKMKNSLTDDCIMLAVAAAIVAQIAITALSLNGLTTVHWTAQAGFIISLVTAALSVFYACLVQQQLSGLFSPEDLKDWLSTPAKEEDLALVDAITQVPIRIRRLAESSPNNARRVTEYLNAVKESLESRRWSNASFHAALMIKSPALLLKSSVVAFLIGLGVYLGCVWTNNVDAPRPRGQSLNILIIYILFTTVGLLLYYIPQSLKYFETTSVNKLKHLFDFDRKPPGPQMQDELEQTIRDISEKVVEWHMREFENENEEFANLRRRMRDHTTGVEERTDKNDVEAGPRHSGPERLDAGRGSLIPEAAQTIGIQPQSSIAQTSHSTAEPLVAALEASIKAQEQSTAALRIVLDAQRKILVAQKKDTLQ